MHYTRNVYMKKEYTEEPKQETTKAKREIQRTTAVFFAEKIIIALEEHRKKLRKNCSVYTQEYVAEKAGISLSTYKGYATGNRCSIDLITAKGIADALGCRLSDIIKDAEK